MNIKARSFTSTTCSRKYSLPQCLMYQSVGLIKPVVLQQSVNTYFMHRIKESQPKFVQAVDRGRVCDLDIDPRNRYLLSGGPDYLAIHDLEDFRDEHNGTRITRNYKVICSVSEIDTYKILALQWNPWDASIFTSSGIGRDLKLWDANLLKTVEKYTMKSSIACHHMSTIATNHNLIAVGTFGSVVNLVDPRAGSAVHSLPGDTKHTVMAVRWSNRDEFILATGRSDKYAVLWDIRNDKRCLRKFEGDQGTTHDGSVNGLSFTADGLHLATIGTDRHFFMWDTLTGRKLPVRYPPVIPMPQPKICLTMGGSENFAFIPGERITAFSLSNPHVCVYQYRLRDPVICAVYREQGNQLFFGKLHGGILVWTPCDDQEYDKHLCK